MMDRIFDAKSTLDDKWRKKNAQIVAEIIRVPTDQVPAETENLELADVGVAVAVAVAVAAAEMAEVIPIANLPISQVMHH
jgi:hypothetical protein